MKSMSLETLERILFDYGLGKDSPHWVEFNRQGFESELRQLIETELASREWE